MYTPIKCQASVVHAFFHRRLVFKFDFPRDGWKAAADPYTWQAQPSTGPSKGGQKKVLLSESHFLVVLYTETLSIHYLCIFIKMRPA